MYKFTAEKALYKWMNGRTPSECMEMYCEVLKKKDVFIGSLGAFFKLWESWIYFNKEIKEHRYLNSRKTISAFLNANVSMDQVTNMETRFIHFEKGCFYSQENEVLGAMFMAIDGNLFVSASVKPKCGRVDHIFYTLSDSDFKDEIQGVTYASSDAFEDFDQDTHLCRDIGKVCFVSALLESTGKSTLKEGLWRKRFKHNGLAIVREYPEPKRTVAWHFRQLRNERYYRGEYKNLEHGSRWIFVCPEDDSNEIKTILK